MTNRYTITTARLFLMTLVWAVAILLAGSVTTSAQTAGPNNAGTGSNVAASVGNVAWSNPGNITASNNTRAIASLSGSGDAQFSQYLRASDLDFEIPTDATILGISVSIERNSQNSIRDNDVRLLKNGVLTGNNKASSTEWGSTDASVAYGGSADLWGTTWTPTDINNVNFGVSLRAERFGSGGGTREARVDAITVTVTYSVPDEEPEGPGDPEIGDEARPTGMYRSVKTGTWSDPTTWEQEMIDDEENTDWIPATQFPSTNMEVLGSASGTQESASPTHVITLPTGVAVGDMILVAFSSRFVTGANIHIGTGWTKLAQGNDGVSGSETITGAIFYKIASGNDALTISTTSNVQSSHVSYRIAGAKRVSGTFASGSDDAPNPPLFAPTDGAGDYLWLATAHLRGNVVIVSDPEDFDAAISSVGFGGTNSATTAMASRMVLNTASFDPTAFSSDEDTEWLSFTLVLDAGNPTAAAIVRDEHVVTTTASVKTLSVIIEDGGTLVVNNDVSMSVANGSTMEVQDGGTLDMLTGTSLVDGPGSFNLQSGGILKIGSNQGIHSSSNYGNIRVDGTRSYSTGGYYIYQGTSMQDPGAGLPSTVAGLGINNSGAGLHFLVNQEVTDLLTLTQGIIHMNYNVLTVSNDDPSAISGGSATSFVSGELRRGIGEGAGVYPFPIGSEEALNAGKAVGLQVDDELVPVYAPTYAPVTVTFQAGSSSGVLAASTSDGDFFVVGDGETRFDPDRTVNRQWNLNPVSGLGSVNYDISFGWNSNDADVGFDHTKSHLGKVDNDNWTYPSISSRAATDITATGLTSFSGFQVGNIIPPSVITDPVDVTITYGDNASFSVGVDFDESDTAFQWQMRTSSLGTWADVTDGGIYSGATTSTLSLTLPTVAMSGYEYRAVVTCASPILCDTAESNEAVLTVNKKTLYIVGSFTSPDKPFDENTSATFSSNALSLDGIVLPEDAGEVNLVDVVIEFDDAYFDGQQPVRITSAAISGSRSDNYELSLDNAPTTLARIIMFRVYGYKFNDLNGNGTWDNNEPGLEGWTIQIQGSAGSYTRTTDANGFYAFDHILPGNYQVREVQQEGWVQSAPGGEGFANVTLTEPRQLSRVDFGNWKYSTIAGSVFKDLSGEGARDAASQDFPGVMVELVNMSNIVVASVETDENGMFTFGDLAPNHYAIRAISPQGYSQSFPGSGIGHSVIVTSGSELSGFEFGLFQPVVLTGFVYLTEVSKAVGGDGQVQELIPAGITVSGVRTGPAPLKLAYASNSFFFEIPEDGFFFADNLLPGLYEVQITLPEYYYTVTQNPIIVELNADIEIEIAFGIAYDVDNAPEVATSSISGSVFFDADGSGTWTSTELGSGSQTVVLTGKSQRGKDLSLTTSSASDGSYTFVGLPAGEYHISVNPTGGLSSAWPMPGGQIVKLGQNEAVGGARLAVSPIATAQAGNNASFANLTLAIDTNLDGTADTRVDASGKMVATLGGFPGQAVRPASVVSFSGLGTDDKGNDATVTAPGMSGSTGTVASTAGQSTATLGMGLTLVLDGYVLYASAPVSLTGNVTGWPFRGVAFSNAGQTTVDLRDPFGHVRARIVLAEFTPLHGVDIGTERADFGDAPNTYGTSRATYGDAFVVHGGKMVYPTAGARHLMPQTGNPSLMLGTGITADTNGKPSDLADADADDGVTMSADVSRGGILTMDITLTGAGKLSAWADWNRDGSFGAGEQILTDVDVDGSFGVYNLSAIVPSDATEGLTFVRFRLSSAAGVGPTGMASDGEVEDYAITVGGLASGDDDSSGDGSGSGGTSTNDDDETNDQPSDFRLGQNYPNPFNPSTVIPFELAQTGNVRLAVYDVTGRQVTLLVNASMGAGRHSVTFNAAGIPSGVYIVRLEAGGRIMTNKLTLLK